VFGVLDLSGNVWEWGLNEPPLPYRDITGGEEVRVRRSGCNADLPENLRTSSYEWSCLDDALPGRGFRCVREP
jgi:formylglycine-generating enzyme required for sulfatase activity